MKNRKTLRKKTQNFRNGSNSEAWDALYDRVCWTATCVSYELRFRKNFVSFNMQLLAFRKNALAYLYSFLRKF